VATGVGGKKNWGGVGGLGKGRAGPVKKPGLKKKKKPPEKKEKNRHHSRLEGGLGGFKP